MPEENENERHTQQLALRVATIEDIESRAPDSKEIWYGHSILTSTLFPPIPPDKGTDYISKSNGSYEYILEAGVDSVTRQRQFPNGKYPRLLMAWMAKQIRAAGKRKTDTVDPETRTITIPSIYQLAQDMGIQRGGTTYKRLQEQLRLLLVSHISIRRKTGFAGREYHDTVNVQIAEAVRVAEDSKDSGMSGAAFVLTKEVYERLAHESAPFDTRATSILLSGRSVLPYDIYVWLTGSMKELKHDLPVSWDWLYERFGDSFSTKDNFRRKFRDALARVKQVYPTVRVDMVRKGLILHPSPTSVPERGSRRRVIDAEQVE